MLLKRTRNYNSKKFLREDEYFKRVQEAVLKRMLLNLRQEQENKREMKKAS